jgi:anaerobic selenocysteine-containing dehydrogenase
MNMQYSPQVLPPSGERRAGWWVIAELMRRLGFDVPAHVPADDRAAGADETMLAALVGPGARCTFEELRDARYVERPLEFPGTWVDDHIARMGGWRLAPLSLVTMLDALLAEDRARLDLPRPLCFISRRQRRKINASLSFLGSPADIILHPSDAAAKGIVHGGAVRVQTKAGAIVLTANVSETMRPGVASIPHGHEIANVNCLTSVEDVDAMTGMVLYTGIPIEVEPVAA